MAALGCVRIEDGVIYTSGRTIVEIEDVTQAVIMVVLARGERCSVLQPFEMGGRMNYVIRLCKVVEVIVFNGIMGKRVVVSNDEYPLSI